MANYFDIIVILIISLSVLFAFLRGFVGTVLGLIRLILSICGALYLRNLIVPFLTDIVFNEAIRNYLAYLIGFLLLMIALSIVRRLILQHMEWFVGGAVDRSMGASLGLLRAAIIICVVFLVWMSGNGSIKVSTSRFSEHHIITVLPDNMPQIVYHSISKDLIIASSELMIDILPHEVWQQFQAEIGLNRLAEKGAIDKDSNGNINVPGLGKITPAQQERLKQTFTPLINQDFDENNSASSKSSSHQTGVSPDNADEKKLQQLFQQLNK